MILYAVDDERPALMLLKSAIMQAIPDAEPECFRDPLALLERAKKTPPDIVFLDIEMPEMNGLELAKNLNAVDARIKIVFVTGYCQYAMEAFDVFASGYLKKPCSAEQIRQILSKIVPSAPEKKDIVIKTFGNFDIFYKGKPVPFRSSYAKQMLAYLVDRGGALVSRQEMAGILFEDDFSRSAQVRLTQFATKLREDLIAAGITDFFFSDNGYSLDMSRADCDLTDLLNGKKVVYAGEYMEQYSFGEFRKGELERLSRA